MLGEPARNVGKRRSQENVGLETTGQFLSTLRACVMPAWQLPLALVHEYERLTFAISQVQNGRNCRPHVIQLQCGINRGVEPNTRRQACRLQAQHSRWI